MLYDYINLYVQGKYLKQTARELKCSWIWWGLQVVDSTDYSQDATEVYESLGRAIFLEDFLGLWRYMRKDKLGLAGLAFVKVSFPQNSVASLQPPPRKVKDLSLEERCPRVKIMTLDEAFAQRSPSLFPMFRCFPLDDASAIISICGMGSPQLLAAIDDYWWLGSLYFFADVSDRDHSIRCVLSWWLWHCSRCHHSAVYKIVGADRNQFDKWCWAPWWVSEPVYRVTRAGCQRQVQDRWNEGFAEFQQKNKAQIWAWKASNDYVHVQAFRVKNLFYCGVPLPKNLLCIYGGTAIARPLARRLIKTHLRSFFWGCVARQRDCA